jgi:hypothetical protein
VSKGIIYFEKESVLFKNVALEAKAEVFSPEMSKGLAYLFGKLQSFSSSIICPWDLSLASPSRHSGLARLGVHSRQAFGREEYMVQRAFPSASQARKTQPFLVCLSK